MAKQIRDKPADLRSVALNIGWKRSCVAEWGLQGCARDGHETITLDPRLEAPDGGFRGGAQGDR